MRISTLPTMISRPAATRSPTTEALWRGSGRAGTAMPCLRCAPRVPRRSSGRRRFRLLLPNGAIVGGRGMLSWDGFTSFRQTRARVTRTVALRPDGRSGCMDRYEDAKLPGEMQIPSTSRTGACVTKLAIVQAGAQAKNPVAFCLPGWEAADRLQELIVRADAHFLEARHPR